MAGLRMLCNICSSVSKHQFGSLVDVGRYLLTATGHKNRIGFCSKLMFAADIPKRDQCENVESHFIEILFTFELKI